MSKESAAKFLQALIDDEELRERTAAMKPEEAIFFAKEMGYDFTLEEFTEVMNEDRELAPEELDSAAGGRYGDAAIGIGLGLAKYNDMTLATHCQRNDEYTGFLHVFVKTDHIEKPQFFNTYTLGYDIYTCKLCKYQKRVHV